MASEIELRAACRGGGSEFIPVAAVTDSRRRRQKKQAMNLNQAVSMGVVLDDVKECAACHFTPEGFTTFRGIGRCVCGTPVLLHIEGVWRNGNPVLLHVRVGGEHCPDCGSALTPTVVTWAGIYSPGAPFIPATTISTNDVCNALALLELEGHR